VLVAEPWDRQNQIDDDYDDDDDQALQQPGSYACLAHTRRTDPVSNSPPPSLRTCTSPDSLPSVVRAVLTNAHTGHVPRAPGIIFLFEGPPTGCGEINFLN